jgi:hypothetical protein
MGGSKTAETTTDTEPGALPGFEDIEDPDPDVVITGRQLLQDARPHLVRPPDPHPQIVTWITIGRCHRDGGRIRLGPVNEASTGKRRR